MNANKLARGLGWFSLGLGLTEVFFARRLGRKLGLEHRSGLLRLFGLREIAAGIGIFAADEQKPWMVGRIVGDALDIALLMTALRSTNPRRTAAAVALGNVAAVTALDVLTARELRA